MAKYMRRSHSGPKVFITPKGHRALREELRVLYQEERPKVVEAVADAAAMGDRSENAEYIYGKKRLREIDRRIRHLSKCLEECEVVQRLPSNRDKIYFNAIVELKEKGEYFEYRIVGPYDPPSPHHINYSSPLGKALMGKTIGDKVVVHTPKGKRILKVMDIQYDREMF